MTYNSKDDLLESVSIIRDRFKNSNNEPVVQNSTKTLNRIQRSNSLTEANGLRKSLIEGILNTEKGITGVTEIKVLNSGYDDGDADGDFDVDSATQELQDNAEDKYTGHCAQYVREALEAGGIDTSGHPVDAKDYGDFLEDKGFEEVEDHDMDDPEKGDIVVIDADRSHPHGHIAMFDGKDWISDTKQRDYSAGLKGDYTVYRFIKHKD